MNAAISTYLGGSAPIGAVVVGSDGSTVSTGANNFRDQRLAHAEMQALAEIPDALDREKLSLYSTMEPCPMCTGAIRMMQLPKLHFATFDPAAGSTKLFGATAFMRRFNCQVTGPSNGALERVNVALTLEYRTRTEHRRWRQEWHAYMPDAVELGEQLARDNRFSVWVREKFSSDVIYDEVVSKLS